MHKPFLQHQATLDTVQCPDYGPHQCKVNLMVCHSQPGQSDTAFKHSGHAGLPGHAFVARLKMCGDLRSGTKAW